MTCPGGRSRGPIALLNIDIAADGQVGDDNEVYRHAGGPRASAVAGEAAGDHRAASAMRTSVVIRPAGEARHERIMHVS